MNPKIVVALPAIAAAFVAASAAPSAQAKAAKRYTELASGSGVQAQFAYTYNPKTFSFSHVTLQISRGGDVALNGVVPRPPRQSYARVWPANFWQKQKSVFVRDLDGDGEAEVFLALYWGGAHCCFFTYVYRYSNGSYRRVYHLWGDPGYMLRDLNHDGLPEFISGDDRFAYAFTDYADSLWPVQIWHYEHGRFSDVTRTFPGRIRTDSRRAWVSYRKALRQRRSTYGVLAAWTADECLLHRCGFAFRRLEALRRAGRLRGGAYDGPPRRYLRHLRRFLAQTGYLR